MTRPILVYSWAPADVLDDLRARFEVDDYDTIERPPLSRADFAARLKGKAGLILLQAPLDAELIAANKATLKVVASVAVGVDNIDVAAATEHGILVTNTAGVLTEAVADMAIGLLLAVGRRIVEADRYTRAGKFRGPPFGLFWGSELHGETLGIVGMGRIGQAVARRARGFGLDVVYHNRHRVEAAVERRLGASWVPLDSLLRRARYVLLLTPLTPETRHLINAEGLALMRKNAYLINVSRGPVVDERALVEALRAGRIAGAALDVYEHEPRLTEGLAALDNVVLTPHVASANVATRGNMVRLAARNLTAALLGEAVPNPVNRIA